MLNECRKHLPLLTTSGVEIYCELMKLRSLQDYEKRTLSKYGLVITQTLK
jgi:hypothetical protein